MPSTLHMPRIGTVRGGGDWAVIERIIQKALADTDFDVYVYDLPQEAA